MPRVCAVVGHVAQFDANMGMDALDSRTRRATLRNRHRFRSHADMLGGGLMNSFLSPSGPI